MCRLVDRPPQQQPKLHTHTQKNALLAAAVVFCIVYICVDVDDDDEFTARFVSVCVGFLCAACLCKITHLNFTPTVFAVMQLAESVRDYSFYIIFKLQLL